MSTKLTYTGAEVQELLDKIGKGDFDNAKTLEGHPASYFAVASELTSLAESFATEQGRINTLYSYFNNGSANDALSLGGQLPSYYATATQYEILQQTLADFKSLFDSMFEKDSDGNIHAKLSLWSSGGITAGGVGSGGSGGGGGESYNRLDSWADYSADKAGYVLSAALGKDLDNRVSALANAGYITASYLAPYALRSEIPSLVGYATQSWVGDNYLSKNGGVITGQGDTRYVQLRIDGEMSTVMFQQRGVEKGSVGWWSAIGVRLQNTNAYGLAVTDSNDPIFYWGQNGSVQRILLHAGNYADYITNSYLKSTLGISDWALASTKPTYTASEVGALGVNGTAQSALKMTPEYLTDLNNATPWRFFDMKTGYGSTDGNKPNIAWVSGITGTVAGSSNYRWQLAMTTGSQNPYFRQEHNGNWNNWSTLAFTSDIPTKLSDLTDDVVAGRYLSVYGGTINSPSLASLVINRNNSTGASVITFTRNSDFTHFLGFNDNSGPKWLSADYQEHPLLHSGNYSSYALPITGGTVNGSITATSFIGGTSTISGDLKGLQNLIFADGYLGRKFSLTNSGGIFFQAPSYSGGWATNWTVKSNDGITSFGDLVGAYGVGDSLNYFYFGGEHNAPSIAIMPSGMIAIGGTTADEKLHVHGNGKFTGALTAPSITANSLTIGGATITYDSVNEALCINGNMYALGGITAGAAGISAYSSLEARVARLEQQLNI